MEVETFIYDVGSGVNTAHIDFADPRRKIEWLYTRYTAFRGQDTPTEIPGIGSHHTCTASKAAGALYGSAKRATLVVVKIPDETEAAFAEVFQTIAHDIISKNRQHHSVINYSYNGRNFRDREEFLFWQKQYFAITHLVDMGVLVFVPAGNHGPGAIKSLPAAMADHFTYTNEPIVVGAVDSAGNQTPWSEKLQVGKMIWAPGNKIVCAKSAPARTGYRVDQGTSFGEQKRAALVASYLLHRTLLIFCMIAAPLVAGVAAEMLTHMNNKGLLTPSARAKFVLERLKWDRPSGLPVIWNLMSPPLHPVSTDSSALNGTALSRRRSFSRLSKT